MANTFDSFWVATLASALLAYPTLISLRKLRIQSAISPHLPESHHRKSATPTMAGLFVIAGICVSAVVSANLEEGGEVITLLLLFTLIGVVDDWVVPRFWQKRGLTWKMKLCLQILATILFIVLFRKPDVEWSALILTGFFIIAFSNAINLTDGLDGLAASLLILAMVPFVVWQETRETGTAWIPAATAGALIPFLAVNAPPAKAFMGDAGSLPLGALCGYLFASSPWQTNLGPWLVTGIFLIELGLVPLQLTAVKLLGRRIFPATPIHHGFEMLGVPETKIVWWFVCGQILLCVLALEVSLL